MNLSILEESKKELEDQLKKLEISRGNLIKQGEAHKAEIDKINQNIMNHNAAINETVGGLNAITKTITKHTEVEKAQEPTIVEEPKTEESPNE